MIRKMKNWPANLMTTGNLFCGFFSIIVAFDGHPQIAGWLIIAAAVLDAFDGKAARFFGGGSKFGSQFDSMADMVSFGMAPGILVYSAAFKDLGMIGMLVAFAPVLAVAVRLARFNVNTDGKHNDFVGLSSPLHACVTASFVIMSFNKWGEILDTNVLAGLVIALSVLMISHLPLPGLPRFTLKEQGYNLVKVLILLGGAIFIAFNPPEHTFPALIALVVSAFAVGIWRSLRKSGHMNTDLDSDDLDDEHDPVLIPRSGRR